MIICSEGSFLAGTSKKFPLSISCHSALVAFLNENHELVCATVVILTNSLLNFFLAAEKY